MSTTDHEDNTSHLMKSNVRNRPYHRDSIDLFATLIVSLKLTNHKQLFRTFPNSFTTDEAIANLAALKFSKSHHEPDPREPTRIVTTTTTTTFSMPREMAMMMCQNFMDARLIEDVADPSSNVFKDRGIYVLTPKGLHILEWFINRNGVNADHLQRAFATQPICLVLLHLERRPSDDEIIISQPVVTALFRHFAGRAPNYVLEEGSAPQQPAVEYRQRAKGVFLNDVVDKSEQTPKGRGPVSTFRFCFSAMSAIEWLCDFTTIVCREEAAEMAGHFVRFGLVTLVSDKRKVGDTAIIVTVRGTPSENAGAAAEYRCTAKAIYRITERGRGVARWEAAASRSQQNLPTSSQRRSNDTGSSDPHAAASTNSSGRTGPKLQKRQSLAEIKFQPGNPAIAPVAQIDSGIREKVSNADRLRHILEEPALRQLFRDFLRDNFADENLAFYMAVQDFKKKFSTSSSAVGAATTSEGKEGQAVRDAHRQALIGTALEIYNTYLAHSSPREINIDHASRNEFISYLEGFLVQTSPRRAPVAGGPNRPIEDPSGMIDPRTVTPAQLRTMISMYEGIQAKVFRTMATDSVPRFIKTPKFLSLENWVDDYEWGLGDDIGDGVSLSDGSSSVGGPSVASASAQTPSASGVAPPGLVSEEEQGGTKITVSQTEKEKDQTVAAVAVGVAGIKLDSGKK
jgi:hypothetical protein